MSIWVILDLLNQFTNTRALSLLHNRMWQSRNSKVHVPHRSALFARDLIRHGLERVAPFYHELFRLQRWSLCFHERNVFGKRLAHYFVWQLTTSCPVLSCAISTLRLLLSSDKHVWVSLVSTTGCSVLSCLTASSQEERVSISWERGAPLWGQTTGLSPSYHDLGLELLGLIGNFWIVTQLVSLVVEHLLNQILSSNHVSRRSLEEAAVKFDQWDCVLNDLEELGGTRLHLTNQYNTGIFFSPPPAAKHAFHRPSDQWIDCGKWLWRFSFILQKWTAPSSSRCTCWEWRRRWITFFNTS